MKIRALALFRGKDVNTRRRRKEEIIYFFRAAQKCVHPLELLPPFQSFQKIPPPPFGDDESKSDKHKREKERSKPIASSHQ
jgi:hypothetical protein